MHSVIGESSKLCRDIFELEKDFKHNLFLLKVKDSEIERCKSQISQLASDLENKSSTIASLSSQLHTLKSQLAEAKLANQNLCASYEERISDLSTRLTAFAREHERREHEWTTDARRRDAETKRVFDEMVESKDANCREEKNKLAENIQAQIRTIQKYKTHIEDTMNDNSLLRSKLREVEQTCTSKIAIFESELQSLRLEKTTIEDTLTANKKSRIKLEADVEKLIADKNQLEERLQTTDKSHDELTKKFAALSADRDSLDCQLTKTSDDLACCMNELRQIKDERKQLGDELEFVKGETLAKGGCVLAEHRNIDAVRKQNMVLQEVVKAMRKERSDAFDTKEIERKMERLEALVGQLKQSMLQQALELKLELGAEVGARSSEAAEFCQSVKILTAPQNNS